MLQLNTSNTAPNNNNNNKKSHKTEYKHSIALFVCTFCTRFSFFFFDENKTKYNNIQKSFHSKRIKLQRCLTSGFKNNAHTQNT